MQLAASPRVTAIIIVLDGEAFIDEAIESVAAQSFADWELLVVDDGSTDGTIERVQRAIRADRPGSGCCAIPIAPITA